MDDCKNLCVQPQDEAGSSGDTAFMVAEAVLGVLLIGLLGLAVALGN